MSKKLKIKFWKAERALAMQILDCGYISDNIDCFRVATKLFVSNQSRDDHLNKVVNAITDELFTSNGELKVGEYSNGEVVTYIWEEE